MENPDNKAFVIKNTETNMYIAEDRNSGGYPYEVKIVAWATIYSTFETATHYKKIFKNPNWKICELIIKDL